MNDLTSLIQDETAHQQNEHGRHCHRQSGNTEYDRTQTREKSDQNSGKQHSTEEAEILSGGQRVSRKSDKDDPGAAHRGHNNLPSVGQSCQVETNNRAQGQTHESRQCKDEDDSKGRISKATGKKQQAKVTHQGDDQAGVRPLIRH